MAKKIFLSPSNQDKNTYSYGNTTEDVQCGKIAKACEIALKRCGFEVKLEQYDTMQNRVAHSNAWGADLHVPIHTNAFNNSVGGTRIFYYKAGSEGQKAAQAVFDALKTITPGKSDACQKNTSLYELNKPKAPAVYVEAEFHDVAEYAKWITEHTTEIGEAICKGICAHFGVTYKAAGTATESETKTETANVLYRVQTGAFSKKGNAENYRDQIKTAGFDAFVVLVDGLYKVQVGAFANKANAQAMLAKVKKAGFTAFITAVEGEAVPTDNEIKVGSTVKVKPGARTYTQQRLASFVYNRNHKVTELVGDRAVIAFEGTVIAAVRVSDLTIV